MSKAPFPLREHHPPSHMLVMAKVMRERYGQTVLASWLEEYAVQFNALLPAPPLPGESNARFIAGPATPSKR